MRMGSGAGARRTPDVSKVSINAVNITIFRHIFRFFEIFNENLALLSKIFKKFTWMFHENLGKILEKLGILILRGLDGG